MKCTWNTVLLARIRFSRRELNQTLWERKVGVSGLFRKKKRERKKREEWGGMKERTMNLLVSKNYKGWRVTFFFFKFVTGETRFLYCVLSHGLLHWSSNCVHRCKMMPTALRKLKERPYLTAMDIFTSNFNLQKIQANTQLIQSKSF